MTFLRFYNFVMVRRYIYPEFLFFWYLEGQVGTQDCTQGFFDSTILFFTLSKILSNVPEMHNAVEEQRCYAVILPNWR